VFFSYNEHFFLFVNYMFQINILLMISHIIVCFSGSKYVVDIAHHYHEGIRVAPVPMIITSVLWLKDPVRIATAGLNDRLGCIGH